MDAFEPLQERLIFINDGAPWIEQWIQINYPKATNILDFYHAVQYLHDFAKVLYAQKNTLANRQQWVEDQIERLLQDGIQEVIQTIEQVVVKGKGKRAAKQKILTYYTNHQHRMYYQTYKHRGLLIGSGPIESAHRFVLQKRRKQSGQKWTQQGGQAVANLRIVYLNNQWSRVIRLINPAKKKVV